jgi:hypothetical protein
VLLRAFDQLSQVIDARCLAAGCRSPPARAGFDGQNFFFEKAELFFR